MKFMQLATSLKALMTEHHLSLTELSKKVKIPNSTLHGWLNGLEPKNISQLKVVADYFDTTIDALCFGKDKKKSNQPDIDNYKDEINAGIFEVVLRRVKK